VDAQVLVVCLEQQLACLKQASQAAPEGRRLLPSKDDHTHRMECKRHTSQDCVQSSRVGHTSRSVLRRIASRRRIVDRGVA
jgi:hypothetical protein